MSPFLNPGSQNPAPLVMPQDDASDVAVLAQDLATAYRRSVQVYRQECQLDPAEAHARARGDIDPPSPDVATHDVKWATLTSLVEQDPAAAITLWSRVRADAVKEWTTGHRAARTVECEADPWDRAAFLALRQAFSDEWEPRVGIEQALIDSLAQCYELYLRWTHRATVLAETEARRQDREIAKRRTYQPPRVESEQAMDQAAAMADRWHRLFLRTLRALQEQRRFSTGGHGPGTVVVQQARQVNVGAQQINADHIAVGYHEPA